MRAQFAGGPYDGLTIHVKDNMQWINLPVSISPAIAIANAVTFTCHARYEVIMKNDFVWHYQFRSISAP
jgi:hypothetical protein